VVIKKSKGNNNMEKKITSKATRRAWIVLLAAAIILAGVNVGKAADTVTMGFEAYSETNWNSSRKKFGSPVHHVPITGDTIAFYAQDAYHLFVLKDGGWAHLRSTDLLNWEDLPMALTKGKPEDAR
jgi:hypothetical protein